MSFRDNFFILVSFLGVVAIGCFAYFSLQVNWPPMGALGQSSPQAVTAVEKVVELTPQQKEGQKLFKTNCGACHRLDKMLTGPALAGVGQKYADDKEWLYSWIRNSQALVKAGDTKAVALFQQYNNSIMQAFPALRDEDIEAILAYTDQ